MGTGAGTQGERARPHPGALTPPGTGRHLPGPRPSDRSQRSFSQRRTARIPGSAPLAHATARSLAAYPGTCPRLAQVE
jgi:hypothetical protein